MDTALKIILKNHSQMTSSGNTKNTIGNAVTKDKFYTALKFQIRKHENWHKELMWMEKEVTGVTFRFGL